MFRGYFRDLGTGFCFYPEIQPDVFRRIQHRLFFRYNDGRAYAATNGEWVPMPVFLVERRCGGFGDRLVRRTGHCNRNDSDGCVATSTITLTEPLPMNMSATLSDFNGFNVPCNGDSLACVTVAIGGGTIPYFTIETAGDTATTARDLPTCRLIPWDSASLMRTDAYWIRTST